MKKTIISIQSELITSRFSLNPLNHPNLCFLSDSVIPILLALLVGLFALTGFGEETTASKVDTDNDGILAASDVDDDNDGLIEINSLDELDNIRHNLDGTSYKTSAMGLETTDGAPAGGLNGHELVRNLDFNDPTNYSSGMVNTAWTTGSGWLPIGNNSTGNDNTRFSGILEGNGYTITNLMISNDLSYIGLFGRIGTTGQVRNLGIENAVADYAENSSSIFIGLLAWWSGGTNVAVHTSGIVNGGNGGNDFVGGLVGNNFNGTITACYATGNADGGDGVFHDVGGLVGNNNDTITASYGFGMVTGRETPGVDRSGDASDSTTVGTASALTMANSSTDQAKRWPARVWDFGTDSQVPVLKWITGYNRRGTTEAERYPCDVALLPDGRECGDIIPGQGR